MLFFILLLIESSILITCSFAGYYNVIKEVKNKKRFRIVFFVAFIMLTANLMIAVKFSKYIPFDFVKQVSYFLAMLFFITLIYSSFYFIIRFVYLKICVHTGHTKGKIYGFLSSKTKSTAVVSLLVFLLGLIGYLNMGYFQQTDMTVQVNKPSQFSQLKCAVISDTHIGVGTNADKLDELTEKINELEPDVILLVGDIVDESTCDKDVEKMISAFKNLKSRYGAFYVSGNHEGIADFNYKKYISQAGITVLDDEKVQIGDVAIIGRKDAYSNRKELDELISDTDTDRSKPVIVLNHEPLQLKKMSEQGADITLCGHTHGEQFPFTEVLFGLANDMMYGEKTYGNMTAITTSGAGGWESISNCLQKVKS